MKRDVLGLPIALLAVVLVLRGAWTANPTLAQEGGAATTALIDPEQRGFWSFQRPVRPPVPEVRDQGWVRNPIDAFVLATLEARGLRPSPPADRRTLIRRVTVDLVGLPPSPEDVDTFLADESPDAYEKLVNRLLASPHYGERWARPWLDLARYAESEGFKADELRPNAWRYRDYVIESFNEDKPYDQFIYEQIAGDEIDPDNSAAIVATGFNRHWADESNARHQFLRRQEILNDITDTTASVFLGLTLECARCHDHKFDPLLQRDYYRFQAFFAAFRLQDNNVVGSRAEMAEYREQMREWEGATGSVRAEMSRIEAPHRARAIREGLMKFPPEVQAVFEIDPSQRTPLQQQIVLKTTPQLKFDVGKTVKQMKKDQRERWTQLQEKLKDFEELKPPTTPLAMAVTDVGPVAPPTYVLQRGVYNSPGEEVQPGFFTLLDPDPAVIPDPPAGLATTGRRTALANWIASPRNPFTARVMINRLWQAHFGQGIVATPGDFGFQGDPPTHPKLLDWLATELTEQGWGLKAMHRLIVTSNTYRQSSQLDPTAHKVDPDNKLLWRMNRRRLEAEMIRDAILAASGQLNPRAGGPSVYPGLPVGISKRYAWKPSKSLPDRNRRSIYILVRRNLRYPLLEVFDMPDTNQTCSRRSQTTTAPQALFVLNSELTLNQARAFAGRVLGEAGTDQEAVIRRAYRLAFCRAPTDEELALADEFLHRQAKFVRELPDRDSLAIPNPMPEGYDLLAGAAMTDFCHALLNANEFIYID